MKKQAPPVTKGWECTLRHSARAGFPPTGTSSATPRTSGCCCSPGWRFEVDGPADFSLRGWLAPWWAVAAMLALLWTQLWSGEPQQRAPHGGVASWLALWLVAALPPGVLSQALGIAHAQQL